MKVLLVALLCVAVAFAGDYQTEDGVLVLTDKDFDAAIQEYDHVLAEFYAPWCGHCKKLTPEYAQAAGELADLPNVKLAKIDCTVEKELASKYEIRGFPTLKFFSKSLGSEPIPYEAGRTAADIVQWLKKKTGPSSVELKSAEDVEKLASDNEVAVVFFGPTGTEQHENFLKAAAAIEDVAFGHATEQTVGEKFEAQPNGIILFKNFDEGKNVYEGDNSLQSVKNFINDNMNPIIFPFTQKVAQKIFGEGKDALFLIVGDDEHSGKAEVMLRGIGKDLRDKVHVSIAKFSDSFGQRLADYIGVAKEHLPAFRAVRPSENNKKYLFELEHSADNLKSFVSDFVENKLKPFFKSEKLPEPDNEENVKIVVGKNFDDVVMNNDNDVLVEYYAPWCGHCKTLAPIYAKLATRLKDVKGVTIAKMDATANEVESVSVSGFPTIKFYAKGKKHAPVDYDGERTEEGFIKYLKEHGAQVDKVQLDEL